MQGSNSFFWFIHLLIVSKAMYVTIVSDKVNGNTRNIEELSFTLKMKMTKWISQVKPTAIVFRYLLKKHKSPRRCHNREELITDQRKSII